MLTMESLGMAASTGGWFCFGSGAMGNPGGVHCGFVDGIVVAPGKDDEGDDGEDDAAVGGHAAFVDAEEAPEGEVGGEGPEEGGVAFVEGDGEVVEEDVADAAADEDAEDAGVEDEVGDAFGGEAEHAAAGEFHDEDVGGEEAHEVGEAVPAGLDGAELEDDGVEVVDVVGEHLDLMTNDETGVRPLRRGWRRVVG